MNVLFITDNISIASGVSSVAMNLYRNIDRNAVKIDFLVCKKLKDSYEKEIQQLGGSVYYVGNFLSVNEIFKAQKRSKLFFEKTAGKYDIVHLHTPTIALFTLKYAKKNGVPFRIVHSHSTMMSLNRLKNIINAFLISKIKRYANVYCACSTEAANFLYGKNFCRENNVQIIHNAVDCSKFKYDERASLRKRKELAVADSTVFAHVSNYSPIKNHMFLPDVIEKLKDTNIRFLFVGNGPTRCNFENEISKRGLEKYCIFIDKTADVSEYLFAADAVILPSLKEGLPVTLVESQAAGLPFFTSDTVTREVQVGQGKFLPLEAEKWYEALSSFKPLSAQERLDNSEAFQKSMFNIKVEAERVSRWYESIVGGQNI